MVPVSCEVNSGSICWSVRSTPRVWPSFQVLVTTLPSVPLMTWALIETMSVLPAAAPSPSVMTRLASPVSLSGLGAIVTVGSLAGSVPSTLTWARGPVAASVSPDGAAADEGDGADGQGSGEGGETGAGHG